MVAVWLWVIIVNLLILGDYFDVALRDFASLGALALARLAEAPHRRRLSCPAIAAAPVTSLADRHLRVDPPLGRVAAAFAELCQHHLLPFRGLAHVGYLPGDRVVGLSKLARVVEWFARDLQTQERLTEQVAGWLEEQLDRSGPGWWSTPSTCA